MGRPSARRRGARAGELPEADQPVAELREEPAQGRVAERAELELSLGRVVAAELRVRVARVAADLGDALAELVAQHPRERLGAHLLGMALAPPAAVEGREVARGGVLAQR